MEKLYGGPYIDAYCQVPFGQVGSGELKSGDNGFISELRNWVYICPSHLVAGT
jgi:hypothetical protein